MARNGAKVLHDEALAYALREGIEILSSASQGNQPGSRIQVESLPSRVTAIVFDDQLEALEADKAGLLFEALLKSAVPLRSHNGLQLLVDRRNWHDRDSFSFPDGSQSLGTVCLVSATGLGIGKDLELIERGSAVLAEANIPCSQRSSTADALHWHIPPEHAQEAQKILHQAFIIPQKTE